MTTERLTDDELARLESQLSAVEPLSYDAKIACVDLLRLVAEVRHARQMICGTCADIRATLVLGTHQSDSGWTDVTNVQHRCYHPPLSRRNPAMHDVVVTPDFGCREWRSRDE